MQEQYRVRSGYFVQFETSTIYELIETGSTTVDIDGTIVGFDVDMRDDAEVTDPHDRRLTIGNDFDLKRLLSGFPVHYYGVLGDDDLTVVFEHRLDGEEIIQHRAGDLVDFDEFVEEATDMRHSEFSTSELPDEDESDTVSNDMRDHWG